ncbi:MAG: TldD/PmbA family protein [Gammaproteobacteria bacterium]
MPADGSPVPDRAFVDLALARCQDRGFDAAQVSVTDQAMHELQAEFGEPAMLRTVADCTVNLTGLIDGRKGSVTLNRKDDRSLLEAVEALWQVAAGALPDDAIGIAEAQAEQSFSFGPESADYDAMYTCLDGLLAHTRARHPTVVLGSATVTHSGQGRAFGNTNGVRFDCVSGRYGGQLMFTARDGEAVSSFNYSGFAADRLDKPFHEFATTDELLRQAAEQVRTKKIPAKFTGDLIITPDALSSFVGFLLASLSNAPLISGTSIYRDKLGEAVAAPSLTLRSCPLSLPAGYRFTADGYPVQDTVVVQDGVLTSFLVDLYGSRKTGLERAATGGGCWVIDAGTTPLAQIIADTGQGVLVTRFSGGRPSENGDFSGVAKNSIDALSAERADFGHKVMPWVRTTGIGVS